MGDLKNLPQKRYTKSRHEFWKGLFNEFSNQSEDHSISGWSVEGLQQRFDTYRSVLAGLHLPQKALVLDLGCGSGVYSRFHAELGSKVIGMDYAVKVAIKAKQRACSTRVDYLAGDASLIPSKDNSFDHVLCIGLFQSLDNHQKVIKEIYRVLKANSPVCLMTLNRREISATLNRIFNREEIIVVDGNPRPRLNTYDPHIFLEELKKAGFTRSKLAPVQILPARLTGFRKILPLWNNLPFLPYLTARSFIITAWRPK